MRSLFIVIISSIAFLASPIASAGKTVPAQARIGVVNVQKVLEQSPQLKVVNASLEKQFKPKRQRIIEAQKKLNNEMQKWTQETAKLTVEQRSEWQDKILSEKTDVESLVNGYKRHLAIAKIEARAKLFERIEKVTKDVAKEKKLQAVLQSNDLIYSDKTIDITNDVIKKLKS